MYRKILCGIKILCRFILLLDVFCIFIRSVKDLARLSLKDPLYVSVHEHSAHTTPESLQQSYIVCSLEDKLAMLWSFIRNHMKQKIIVFFSSCKQVIVFIYISD